MEAKEVIGSLQNELAMEQAKNAVLLEKLLELEDGVAESRLSEFDDVIPNEDRDYWRGQFLENGKKAADFLGRLRNRLAAVPAKAADAAAAAEAKPAAPRPMHNRGEVVAKAPVTAAVPERSGEVAARIRNRAQEISRKEGVSYTVAFARAEREAGV